jgi:nucleotide-binding universal stress UspA family protein
VSVAVAHQTRSTAHAVLREAAREAGLRGTTLTVIHVAESLDADVAELYRAGISDDIERALGADGLSGLSWSLLLGPGNSETGQPVQTAQRILRLAGEADAELLVIGGRRRSAVGKALMGSITQQIILGARTPVLVVMPDD